MTLALLLYFSNFVYSVFTTVTYSPECGLEHGKGFWTVRGELTLRSREMFVPKITLLTTSEICSIDLSYCLPSNEPVTEYMGKLVVSCK